MTTSVDGNTNLTANVVKNSIGMKGNLSTSFCSAEIVPFLKDKYIFITGATGFLGKVLMEKILRVQPNVRHLYILVKAQADAKSTNRRVKEEILGSDLFEFLQHHHGEEYEAFMEQRVSVVVGDIRSEKLGMDASIYTSLATKLDIIVHSAALTRFSERYDCILDVNTEGPRRIMEFAKTCQHLQLLMHVSTAFVHGKHDGLLLEKTFNCGYNNTHATVAMAENQDPKMFVELELKLVKEKLSALTESGCPGEKIVTLAMQELGLKRANKFGWQNVYLFTKALGEMVVESMKDDLPVVIVRPSIVESSLREPFPGWIQGNRVMDPIIISYGKGLIPGMPMDLNSVANVVPVDMAVNVMLAAMAKHASTPGVQVYHAASSIKNPLYFSALGKYVEEYFKVEPFLNSIGDPIRNAKFQMYPDMQSYMDALHEVKLGPKESNSKSLEGGQQLARKAKEYAIRLAKFYVPFTFYVGRFDTSNTQQLYESLSAEDKESFGLNFDDIDWETYIKKIHIPGLRKHACNEG